MIKPATSTSFSIAKEHDISSLGSSSIAHPNLNKKVNGVNRLAKTVFDALKDFFSHFASVSNFFKAKHEFKGYQAEVKTFEDQVKENYAAGHLQAKGLNETEIKDLARQKASEYLVYCGATIACFKQDKDWVEPFGFKFFNPKEAGVQTKDISPTLEAKEDCLFDPAMGIKAIVTESDNKVIVCFGSLETGNYEFRLPDQAEKAAPSQEKPGSKPKMRINEKKAAQVRTNQMATVYANTLGLRSKVYDQADLLFQKIASLPQFKGKTITLAGQCFGGSLAAYVALKNQVPAYCFNTFPLGVGQQEKIGKDRLNEAKNYVTHISAATDYVSVTPNLSFVDWVLSSLRILTTGNFGKRFYIPSAYNNSAHTHAFIQGSMMKYLGHDMRATPKTVLS